MTAMMNELSQQAYKPPSSIRPYRCDVCHRSFREVATLRKHEQLHRADRPYICTTCGKSFLWSSNLKVHERVHTGERPYKCKICHRCFTQSNDLRRHERNVHLRHPKPYPGCKQQLTTASLATNPRQSNNSQVIQYQQAIAMQHQAALFRQAMYESMLQSQKVLNVSTSGLPHAPTVTSPTTTMSEYAQQQGPPLLTKGVASPDGLKTEQITPPSTPAMADHIRQMVKAPIVLQGGGLSLVPIPPPTVIQTPRTRISTPISQSNSLPAIATMLTPSQFPLDQHIRLSRTPTSPPLLSPQTSLPYLPPAHRFSESMIYQQYSAADKGVDLRVPKVMSAETNIPDGTSGMDSESDEKSEESGKGDNSSRPSTPSDEHRQSTPSDTEGDEKRAVTTTTASPSADYEFYRCNHCDIYFRDYTMYHLHQSLHSPNTDDPFYCPSCQKHCHDRIEFTFHLVWHIRYPHTIPNYELLQDSYVASHS